MNISKQLISMLIIAVLGLVGVFSIGITKMGKVFEQTNTCNINSLPSVLVMADMQKTIYKIRILIWEHKSAHDKSEMLRFENLYKNEQASFEKDLKRYEQLISDDKDRSLLEQEKTLFSQYHQAVETFFKLSGEEKKEEAIAFILTQRSVVGKLSQTLDEHMLYNQKLAENDAKNALEEKSSATRPLNISCQNNSDKRNPIAPV